MYSRSHALRTRTYTISERARARLWCQLLRIGWISVKRATYCNPTYISCRYGLMRDYHRQLWTRDAGWRLVRKRIVHCPRRPRYCLNSSRDILAEIIRRKTLLASELRGCTSHYPNVAPRRPPCKCSTCMTRRPRPAAAKVDGSLRPHSIRGKWRLHTQTCNTTFVPWKNLEKRGWICKSIFFIKINRET